MTLRCLLHAIPLVLLLLLSRAGIRRLYLWGLLAIESCVVLRSRCNNLSFSCNGVIEREQELPLSAEEAWHDESLFERGCPTSEECSPNGPLGGPVMYGALPEDVHGGRAGESAPSVDGDVCGQLGSFGVQPESTVRVHIQYLPLQTLGPPSSHCIHSSLSPAAQPASTSPRPHVDYAGCLPPAEPRPPFYGLEEHALACIPPESQRPPSRPPPRDYVLPQHVVRRPAPQPRCMSSVPLSG